MKIGYCASMNPTTPDGTGVEIVERLAALGFDYIELPLAAMEALSDEAFDALLARVEASGIHCEACNNFFPNALWLTGPDVDEEAVDAYLRRALARAGRLGAEHVVFGSGPAKQVPEGFPMQDGYRQVVDMLRRAAPLAKAQRITIVIEPLRRAECNLINTFAEGCRLAKDVDHDSVKVLVDYYHLCQEDEPVGHLLADGKTWLRHAHFAREEGRTFPAGEAEDARYAPFFAALRDIGYDRRISLEAYCDDFEAVAPGALAFFRRETK